MCLKRLFHFQISTKKDQLILLFILKTTKNKKNMYPINFIKRILLYNYNVYVVGDKMKINGVTNIGYLNHLNLKSYLKKTRFCIASTENILSFFYRMY